MSKSKELAPSYFLNRLALDENMEPSMLDPLIILQELYSFARPVELREMLEQFCAAALDENYKASKGSPGEMLFFFEKLERLIEACFLIHASSRKKPGKSRAQKPKPIPADELPISLTAAEYNDPVLVLEGFFTFQSIGNWKRSLYHWLEASLSRYSVVETETTGRLLGFNWQLEKLIQAGYRLVNQ